MSVINRICFKKRILKKKEKNIKEKIKQLFCSDVCVAYR